MLLKGKVVSENEVHTISQDGCGSFIVVVKNGKLTPGEIVSLRLISPKVVELLDSTTEPVTPKKKK